MIILIVPIKIFYYMLIFIHSALYIFGINLKTETNYVYVITTLEKNIRHLFREFKYLPIIMYLIKNVIPRVGL